MNRKFAVVAVAVVSLIGVALAAQSAMAQSSSVTISISPPVFEMSANPGESIKNNIRVTNLSDQPQTIFVDKRNFTALGEEGGVDLTEDNTSHSLASWIAVNKEQATIPAKKSEVFEFVINTPVNAEPGGHFGSLVFKTEPQPLKEGQSGSSVGQEVGALLLVKIAGDIKEQAEVASFKSQSGFYEAGPVTFETRVKNAGNVHLKPRGTITIHNMFGVEVAKVQIDERNVLPDAIRSVQTTWDAPGFRLGMYTAKVSLVYGDASTLLTASSSFFLFPYKLILAILVVIAVIAFVGYRYRDRFQAAFKALSGK